MKFFRKKCALCGVRIGKGKEFLAEVKVPELKGIRQKAFCSEKHAESYKCNVTGTKRTNFCPTCPLP